MSCSGLYFIRRGLGEPSFWGRYMLRPSQEYIPSRNHSANTEWIPCCEQESYQRHVGATSLVAPASTSTWRFITGAAFFAWQRLSTLQKCDAITKSLPCPRHGNILLGGWCANFIRSSGYCSTHRVCDFAQKKYRCESDLINHTHRE